MRAAKAVGARWYRVLGRHLLPNTLGVLIIAIFLELPGVILGEAFLSFIGLGINPPDASWGSMAQDGLRSTASTRTSSSSRRSRSRRWSSARTSSPTACATPSTRERGRRRVAAARRRRPEDALLHARGRRARRRRRLLRGRAGRTLGIVGESGCGKSVTALSIMGLIPKPPAQIVGGPVLFEGRDLTTLSEKQLEDVRGQRDRDDLPGPDDVAEPDADDRDADHRDDPAPPRRDEGAGAASARSSCSRRCGSRTPPSGSTTTRTATRAACASA